MRREKKTNTNQNNQLIGSRVAWWINFRLIMAHGLRDKFPSYYGSRVAWVMFWINNILLFFDRQKRAAHSSINHTLKAEEYNNKKGNCTWEDQKMEGRAWRKHD